MAIKDTLTTEINGKEEELFPYTLDSAVLDENGRPLDTRMKNVAKFAVTEENAANLDPVTKIDADMLEGHDASYFDEKIAKNSQNIQVNSGRIDQFTKLAEESTTGDAELADIRVKADGSTAATAGDAVREQVSELKETIESLQSSDITGDNNKSAYEVAVENGYTGTELEWLELINQESIINTGLIFKYNICSEYNVNKYTDPVVSNANNGIFTISRTDATTKDTNISFVKFNLPQGNYTACLTDIENNSNLSITQFDPKIRIYEVGGSSWTTQYAWSSNQWVNDSETTSSKCKVCFSLDHESEIQFAFFIPSRFIGDKVISICLTNTEHYTGITNYSKYACDSSKIVDCNPSNLNQGDKVKVYYISNFGNDNYDGLSPNSPKKSITNIIKNNTIILFHSGETFFLDNINITGRKNIILSSYDKGNRPIISGLRSTNSLFEEGIDEYMYTISLGVTDIGYIILDGVKSWSRRDNLDEVTEFGDWYYDKTERLLYYKSDISLVGKTIQYSHKNSGILIMNSSEICVYGLEISSYANHGININSNTQDIKIIDNYVHDIGGSYQYSTKYGNGIQTWLINEQNIEIRHNIVTDCFDAGITPQVDASNSNSHTMDNTNIVIIDNYIARCAYPIEVFSYQGSYCTMDLYIGYNFIDGCYDISNGYRGLANKPSYEDSSRPFGIAQFQLWHINGANPNKVTLSNNICIGSCDYALSFSFDSEDQYDIHDNVFIIKGDKFINDETLYHGNDNVMITIPDIPVTTEDYAKLSYYITKANTMISTGENHNPPFIIIDTESTIQPPVEEPPVVEPPIEEPPVVEPPIEEPPVEDDPIDPSEYEYSLVSDYTTNSKDAKKEWIEKPYRPGIYDFKFELDTSLQSLDSSTDYQNDVIMIRYAESDLNESGNKILSFTRGNSIGKTIIECRVLIETATEFLYYWTWLREIHTIKFYTKLVSTLPDINYSNMLLSTRSITTTDANGIIRTWSSNPLIEGKTYKLTFTLSQAIMKKSVDADTLSIINIKYASTNSDNSGNLVLGDNIYLNDILNKVVFDYTITVSESQPYVYYYFNPRLMNRVVLNIYYEEVI